MTEDTDAILARWHAEEQARKETAKTKLFQLLAARQDIAAIEVTYDGCGDDGQIENIAYCDSENQALDREDKELDDAVEEYVFGLLPGGWEINDGSFGTVRIDARTQKAHIEHSSRFVDHETSEWED